MMNGKDMALNQLRAEELRREAERQQRAKVMTSRRKKHTAIVTDLANGLIKTLQAHDAKSAAAVPEVGGQPEPCPDA